MTYAQTTMAGMIEGAAGILVFGNGITAVQVDEVVEVLTGGNVMVRTDDGDILAVNLAAVAYFRYTDDD